MLGKRPVILVAVALLVVFLGAAWYGMLGSRQVPRSFWEAFEHGTKPELLSLDPRSIRESQPLHIDGQVFYKPGFPHGRFVPAERNFLGYEILGRTVLTEDETRDVLRALWWGTAENSIAEGGCFEPRHGLRVAWEGHRYEAVICFHCLQIYGFVGGRQTFKARTSKTPAAALNAILTRHGVPLPDPKIQY